MPTEIQLIRSDIELLKESAVETDKTMRMMYEVIQHLHEEIKALKKPKRRRKVKKKR
jgi:hypothetical protein